MDIDRSLVAHQLISAVDSLYPIIEGLKCVIVGDGNDFENVKKEAETVNEKYGKNVIVLTGRRTDISEIIAFAELFVGVSRAALEAMASEKPSVIAGNEGYIGLFSEDKLGVALETNFCCRGQKESETAVLTQDIANFFGMWDEEKERIGKYGRDIVLENYSVKRMADDAEKVYKEAMEELV